MDILKYIKFIKNKIKMLWYQNYVEVSPPM
jgi:hypothetical protein